MMLATLIALTLLPPVVLRGRTLATYYLTDAATYLLAWLVVLRAPVFDYYIGGIALAVVKLSTLMLFLARGRNVRWSANRAALVAAVVYAFMVPSMTRFPIDGDEPFYLLITESIVRDQDLDLANQYRTLETSETGRPDLVPQIGDPVGKRGQQYSRHEPFLALLMVPGYLAGGLHGALATIALFGLLLVRATFRWLEDEGIDEATSRAVFPFFALGTPILFFASRIWTEVPAAYFFVEALRGLRSGRTKRWIPALLGLVLLKLRFVLVAVGLLVAQRLVVGGWWLVVGRRPSPRSEATTNHQLPTTNYAFLALLIAAPMLLLWLAVGNPLSVHSWRELLPEHPENYIHGFLGLLLDGAAGFAFQAPFYLLALVALTRWRETPEGFRLGVLASLLYLLYLLPRDEWHGGWAPPLRYVVFLTPVLTLGIAAIWTRVSRGVIALISMWTAVLVTHGISYPWRLFHIANGENALGEWLSLLHQSDFSRLFPSFIRVNDAAWFGTLILIAVLLLSRLRIPSHVTIAAVTLAFAIAFSAAKRPGRTIHFEDAHVRKEGGELHPPFYAPVRFAYRGGWVLNAGNTLTFQATEGAYTLHYVTGPGGTLELEGRAYVLPPSPDGYTTARIVVPRTGRVTLRCVAGAVNLDRMEHD